MLQIRKEIQTKDILKIEKKQKERIKQSVMDMMMMNPTDKQKFFDEYKKNKKMNERRERQKADYEIKNIIYSNKVPCSFQKINSAPVSPGKRIEQQLLLARSRRQKLESFNINELLEMKGLTGRGSSKIQEFQNLFDQTFKDYKDKLRDFESERLKEKLRDRGSLYGVPSTVYSNEKELADLIANMPTMITKPISFMKEKDISKNYELFNERAKEIKQEEKEKQRKLKMERDLTRGIEEIQINSKIAKDICDVSYLFDDKKFERFQNELFLKKVKDFSKKEQEIFSLKKRNLKITDRDYEEENSQEYSLKLEEDNHRKNINSTIIKKNYANDIFIHKPKPNLITSLNHHEQEQLRMLAQMEMNRCIQRIERKYRDNQNGSQMIDEKENMERNQIMRRINIQKLKQNHMPNYTRLMREKILQARPQHERKYSLHMPQEYNVQQQNSNSPTRKMIERKSTKKATSLQKIDQEQEINLRGQFIQHLKDVLTKTSSSCIIAGAHKLRTQKLQVSQPIDDMVKIVQSGVIGKREAVEELSIPQIQTNQIRQETFHGIY